MSDAASIEYPAGLTGGDFTAADEPLRLFAAWFAEAKSSEPVNPEAMTLATVDAAGLPNARMVLLKGFDERGFVFYTNAESIKGHELAAAPKAALAFYWKSLQRQVRLRGDVEAVSNEEADAYFATRSRMAQIGAWAQNSRRRWKAGSRSKRPMARFTPRNSRSEPCRGRRTGSAIGSCRRRSNFGKSGRSGCTTVSCLSAKP